MSATELHQLLLKLDAPQEMVEWVTDKSLHQAWEECEHPDWMLWLCEKMMGKPGWPTHQQIVLAACACAETVLYIYEKKYPAGLAPRRALEAARAWVRGRVTWEEVRSAVAAAKEQIILTSPSVAANNAAVAAHDAAASATPTYEGAAANAVRAAVAAEAWPRVFLRSKIRKKFADLVRRDIIIPANLTDPETVSKSAIDRRQIPQSARDVHEPLQSWMRMLFSSLEEKGTSQEDAALQMSALFGRMEEASKGFAPPIASLAMISIVTSYIQYLTREEGQLNGITAELAVAILPPLMRLGDTLDAVLKEEGWKKEEITAQVSTLSEKIIGVTSDSVPGIAPLTFAFTADNYAKLLIKGTMIT